MDNANINHEIAVAYNDGQDHNTIKQLILEKLGVDLSVVAIQQRIRRMRQNGTLDITPDERVGGQSNVDAIDQIFDDHATEGLWKIGVLDIETTGLWADFGYVLCAVIQDIATGQFEVFRLDELQDFQKNMNTMAEWRLIDKPLVEAVRSRMEAYDMIVHFNGRNFDMKFLNTRLTRYGLNLLPRIKQVDICQVARYKMRLRSNKLDALKNFLEVDEDETGHNWVYWQMAGAGKKAGYDYVVDHCKRDVQRLSVITKRMRRHIDYVKN